MQPIHTHTLSLSLPPPYHTHTHTFVTYPLITSRTHTSASRVVTDIPTSTHHSIHTQSVHTHILTSYKHTIRKRAHTHTHSSSYIRVFQTLYSIIPITPVSHTNTKVFKGFLNSHLDVLVTRIMTNVYTKCEP